MLAGVLDGGGPHARACAAAAPESRPDGGGVYGCILARALEITCAPCPFIAPLCTLSAPSLHPPLQHPAPPLPNCPPTHPLAPLRLPLRPLPSSPSPLCTADPHVHRRLRAPPPLFNFQRERLQFLQEASATAEPEHVVPTPTRFPCTSAACRLVLTAPPSREPIFFSRTGVGD